MPGLLQESELDRVFNAWRRSIRFDPLLSRVAIPDLHPLSRAFNNALTGEDDGELAEICNDLVRQRLEPHTVTRLATFLAETFADEVGTASGAVSRSLVSTLGLVCGLMMTTMVSDVTQLAYRDPLTGLENRRAWDEAIAGYAESGRTLSVCMIDLDGLKVINDTQGHDAGDRCLSQFGKDLSTSTHTNGRAFRFGGDEYGMLLPDADVRDLQQVIQQLHVKEGIASFSYGIASTADQFNKMEDLTELADSRMYEMKRERKRQQEVSTTSGENARDTVTEGSYLNAIQRPNSHNIKPAERSNDSETSQ